MNNKIRNLIIITMFLFSIYLSISLISDLSLLIKKIFKIFFPILLGFCLAFVLNPIKECLTKKKIPNLLATIIVIIVLITIILLFIIIVIPNLVNELSKLINNIPNYLNVFETAYNKYLQKFHLNSAFKDIFFTFLSSLTQTFIAFLQAIISYSFSVFVAVFISFYILYDFRKIIEFIKVKTSSLKYNKLRIFLKETKECMYSFVKGTIQENFILFILALISFVILGLDYAVIISLILAVTNIIPYLGPYLGGSFAVIVGLNTSKKIAILAFLIVIVLQLIDNYIINPKIQSRNNNIKPIFIIMSIVIMGSVFGIVGMICAVPIVLIGRVFLKTFV